MLNSLIFDNKYIDELLRSNSENENTYKLIREIILQCDYSYVNFVYSIFSVYSNIYINVCNRNSELTYTDIQKVVNKLSTYKNNIVAEHIVTSDMYDILYNMYSDDYQFNSIMYDDIFSRLSNVYKNENIVEVFESIIKTLSNVFSILDSNIFNFMSSKNKDFNGVIYIHLEIVDQYLFLNIVV